MVVVAPTLQSVVGRSVALDTNAQMLASILQMHGTPVYVVPAANAASEPGNFGREWEWWKHKAGAD